VGTASLAGTICFRVSQNCIELAQNRNRPRRELHRVYEAIETCKESTVPRLIITQCFAVIRICPPSLRACCTGHYLHAVNQVNYSSVLAAPASALTGTNEKDLSGVSWSWAAVLGDSPLYSNIKRTAQERSPGSLQRSPLATRKPVPKTNNTI